MVEWEVASSHLCLAQGEGAGGRIEGQTVQMEDSSRHLGHCMVDMKELSANPEGLSAAGELIDRPLHPSPLPLSSALVLTVTSLKHLVCW